jgi:hypothetical protein
MSDPVFERAAMAATAKAMRGVADTFDIATVNHTEIPGDVAAVAHDGDLLDATADLLDTIREHPADPIVMAAAQSVCGAFWKALGRGTPPGSVGSEPRAGAAGIETGPEAPHLQALLLDLLRSHGAAGRTAVDLAQDLAVLGRPTDLVYVVATLDLLIAGGTVVQPHAHDLYYAVEYRP